jgi:acyl-CoA thioester hydrolase
LTVFIETPIVPRFCDTDAMGHINNTAVPQWLEMGRTDLLMNRLPKAPTLMARRLELDYDREMYFDKKTVVKTAIEKLGNSSVVLRQEVWQDGELRAKARDYEVFVDMTTRRAAPLPQWLREALADYMIES